MNGSAKEVELRVGRRSQDGRINLSAHMPGLLTLSVSYGAERSSTVMLTPAQAAELRQALAGMEQLLEQAQAQEESWDGAERRRPAPRLT